MPTSHIILFTSLFLLLNLTFSLQDDKHSKSSPPHFHKNHEFVAGRTMEYLPGPIFYDTYIPVIYKMSIPRYTEGALRLQWADVHLCNSSSTASGNLCPISYHLFQVTKKLADDLGFWKPYYVNHTSSRKESLKKRTGFEIVCNEISQHFFRSYTTSSQLDSYMTALKACSRIPFRGAFMDPNHSWVVNKSIYYKMLQSFRDAYFADLPQKGKVDWAVFLNAYTSVHGLLLTNHVMESVRLATAHRVCQSGLIPETFISMDMLKLSLQELGKNITSRNYELVYGNLEQDMEEYYKLPLADCTFSDDYTFIIRILVPVKRQDISHRLVEIKAIPFLENLPPESGIPTRLCRLKLAAPKFTLIETSTGLLLDTRCGSNQLCKTSEVATVFENDACTTSLRTDDRRLITDTCKLSCFTVSARALPLIQRVSSDTYVVVGTSDTTMHLNCFSRPTELPNISLKNVGALKIKLACDCQLLYSDHVSYRPRDPCGGETVVEHILPYHWYRNELNNVTGEKIKRETEPTVTEATIEDGNEYNPKPSPTSGTNSGPNDDGTSKDTNSEGNNNGGGGNGGGGGGNGGGDGGNGGGGGGNGGGGDDTNNDNTAGSNSTSPKSTTDINDSQIEQSIEKQEEELGSHFGKQPKHQVVFQKLSEIPDGLVIQLCILWILIFILIFVILVLGYHVHKLLKWKELQAYKETRVLYRPNENKIVNNKL